MITKGFPATRTPRKRFRVVQGCIAVIGLGLLGVMRGEAQTFDCAIAPQASDNFTRAEFRCYLPPGVDPVRGVMILVPGHNVDGRDLIGKDGWPDFAARNKVALLACFFEDDDSRDYSNADRGSGRAVIQALRDLDKLSGRRELAQANFMVWGISSGAQFAASMCRVKPDRMFGFASMAGASWFLPDVSSRKIPGLFVSSADQQGGAAEKTRKYVHDNRALGANWALLEVDTLGTIVQSLTPLAQAHLEASMAIRQKAEAYPGGKLESLTQVDGWVVNYTGGGEAVGPSVDLPRSGLKDSYWFPSRQAAEMWLASKAASGKK